MVEVVRDGGDDKMVSGKVGWDDREGTYGRIGD